MTIPKIIHQIAPANKDSWHPLWKKCQQSWLDTFPDFEYKLWNDKEDLDNLVKQKYSRFYSFFSELPVHIMKIDFARFCILHDQGGIYADMDMFCYTNFYEELESNCVYLMPAPYGNETTNGKNLIENALMISPKNNTFFNLCMQNSVDVFYSSVKKREVSYPLNNFEQILIGKTAGPVLVSDTFSQYNKDVKILNYLTFNNHGLSYDESYNTKHLLTGCWGEESHNLKDPNLYLQEVAKFVDLEGVTLENFDFYCDYTKGGYIKEFKNICGLYTNDVHNNKSSLIYN